MMQVKQQSRRQSQSNRIVQCINREGVYNVSETERNQSLLTLIILENTTPVLHFPIRLLINATLRLQSSLSCTDLESS
jgi:hypothetical protein